MHVTVALASPRLIKNNIIIMLYEVVNLVVALVLIAIFRQQWTWLLQISQIMLFTFLIIFNKLILNLVLVLNQFLI